MAEAALVSTQSYGSPPMIIRKKMVAAHRGVPLNRTAFAIVIGVLCFAASRLTSNEKKVSKLQTGDNISISSMELCAKPEDLAKLHEEHPCTCEDPVKPMDWLDNPLWLDHHNRLVKEAERTDAFDLVIIGDSITERINGTRHQGNVMLPENRAIFESTFIKSGGGKIDALALGSSGDTSENLLWHLENGMLPDTTLNPKVWLVLIGTNNLGRTLCSKEATLRGILEVVTRLRSKRPEATVLLHGLLPRSDNSMAIVMKEENYKLGFYWEQIQWINQRLKESCNDNSQCVYMETIDIFLSSKDMINKETLTDALHPSSEGIKKWGPLIVEKVQGML